MLPLLFFLTALIVASGVAFALTNASLGGPLLREGPGPIARSIRRRNRLFITGAVIFVVLFATLEALVPDLHLAMLDLAYSLAAQEPFGVITFASGAGVSWGLYLAVVLGTMAGLVVGSFAACRRHEHAGSLRIPELS